MRYFSVPFANGKMDIDYLYLREAVYVAEDKSHVKVSDNAPKRATWTEITEQEFEAQKPIEPAPDTTKTKSPLEDVKDQLLAMELSINAKITKIQEDLTTIKQSNEATKG